MCGRVSRVWGEGRRKITVYGTDGAGVSFIVPAVPLSVQLSVLDELEYRRRKRAPARSDLRKYAKWLRKLYCEVFIAWKESGVEECQEFLNWEGRLRASRKRAA